MNSVGASAAASSSSMDEFRAGVTACLRSWSALRTAAEAGWGGVDSLKKANDLRAILYDMFDGSRCPPPPSRITLDDLEDNLAIFMEEEFSVTLEDASEKQVAETIWRMYEECFKGDVTLARQIVAIAEQAVQVSAAFPAKLQPNEYDDDDDGDEEMMDTDGMDEGDGDDNVIPDAVDLGNGSYAVAAAMGGGTNQNTLPLVQSALQQAVAAAAVTPSVVNAAEYAAQPLFGGLPKKQKKVREEPVRQLGDTPAQQAGPEIEVDDDGFAPVVKGRRKR